MSAEQELEQTILDFTAIQADLHYKHAQDALRELLVRLDLTPQEQAGLEPELRGLIQMLDKLERSVIHIAAFGLVGRGKSSLLNALVGQPVFTTGPTHGVTRSIQRVDWSVERENLAGMASADPDDRDRTIVRVTLSARGKAQIQLIDTPGIDEVAGEEREQLAKRLARQADLILFVITGDMTRVEHQALSELRQASKPILLVFNKVDQYPDTDRDLIYATIRDQRVRELLSPDEIVMAAAAPLVPRWVQRDGQSRLQLQPGPPQVEALKLKILEILDREGKALIALNTMLYADEVNEQVVQRKLAIREQAANQVIWNAVMMKALAIALNPVTVVDIFSGAIIDVAMILTLSRLYGIAMTETGAVNLLQKIALSMGSIGASELLANLGLSGLKGILGASAPVTGGATLAPYLSVAVTQAGVAGVSSYSIGQITKTYLAQGATWGPDGPKAVVSEILAALDETSILSRIKTELRARLQGQAGAES
ncbi:GTP-binding protein [Trichothermofontia sp.]